MYNLLDFFLNFLMYGTKLFLNLRDFVSITVLTIHVHKFIESFYKLANSVVMLDYNFRDCMYSIGRYLD